MPRCKTENKTSNVKRSETVTATIPPFPTLRAPTRATQRAKADRPPRKVCFFHKPGISPDLTRAGL